MLAESTTLPDLESVLPAELARAFPVPLSACFQCRKCSGGCPMTFAMDLLPDEVIRLSLLGQDAAVLGCRTIWVCSSCETCTTRCPNAIDIAGVMDWLKEESLRRGYESPQPQVAKFHQTFLDTIRLTGGRLSEPVLLGLYQLKSGGLVAKIKSGAIRDELRLAWELLRRGRLRPKLPLRLQGRSEIKKIFAESKRRASK